LLESSLAFAQGFVRATESVMGAMIARRLTP
jgi:hypothetical protein